MMHAALRPPERRAMSKARTTPRPEKLFRDMTRGEKVAFIAKACVFLISGGFIYPTLWID
jgi:hypothetical protein